MKKRFLSVQRRLLKFLICCALVTLTPAAWAEVPLPGSEGKTPLSWAPDFNAALKTAEKEKKAVVMDVTTDWCGWSKKMDRETFAKASVQEHLKNCVLVRLNPETSEENHDIAQRYGVDGYPTMIILNYRGEALAEKSGYQDEEKCAKFLKGALGGFTRYGPLGYTPFELPKEDLLRQAIARRPKPDAVPTSAPSYVLLDYSSLVLSTGAVARADIRMAEYAVDPDRGPLKQVSRMYNSDRETLKLKAVRILDVNGKGREVDLALAEDEHYYSDQAIYWDVREVTLEVPPLQAGQILDVVEEREMRPVMPGQFSWRWATAPGLIVLGDLTISFPEKLGLQKHAVRCATPVTETRGNDGTVTWRLVTQSLQLPDPELFAAWPFEEWQGYLFSTRATWDGIASWYNGLCRGRGELPQEAKTKIAELKQQNANPEQLLQAIFAWVTKEVYYVSVSFGLSSHQPHTAAETLKNKYGDCKDQSLLLQALCREAGIPSSLVLLGVGCDRQLDGPLPTISSFDHCILEAAIGGKRYYLDASAGPAPLDWLPVHCSGAQALKIGEKTGEIVTLPPYKALDSSTERKTVRLNPNGSATVTDVKELTGPPAHAAKLGMRQTNLNRMRKNLEDSLKKAGQKLLEFSVTDPKSEGDTYQYKVTYTLPRFASHSAGGLVFQLGDVPAQGQDWAAALESPRVRPFRFYPSDVDLQIYEVELPTGAELKSKPEDLEIQNNFLRASRKTAVTGNKVTLTEKSVMLDAKLASTESAAVSAALKKFQDSRAHSFFALLPTTVATNASFGGVSKIAPQYQAALDAHDLTGALKLVGQTGAFKGTVDRIYEPESGSVLVLNFDPQYLTATTAVLKRTDFDKFPDVHTLVSNEVLVSGKFSVHKGRPEIQLTEPDQIKLVK
jgi:thiol-disulfide isomerase/thioredoxin